MKIHKNTYLNLVKKVEIFVDSMDEKDPWVNTHIS